ELEVLVVSVLFVVMVLIDELEVLIVELFMGLFVERIRCGQGTDIRDECKGTRER
ncbi:hypothetical protein Tco_0466744, partial [Tanacetum coccineum]